MLYNFLIVGNCIVLYFSELVILLKELNFLVQFSSRLLSVMQYMSMIHLVEVSLSLHCKLILCKTYTAHCGCLDSKKNLSTFDAPPGVQGVSKKHIFFTNETVFCAKIVPNNTSKTIIIEEKMSKKFRRQLFQIFFNS